jgi:hypothetical protein
MLLVIGLYSQEESIGDFQMNNKVLEMTTLSKFLTMALSAIPFLATSLLANV